MKLNYKRTICVGFAFFLICAFWQAYDTIIPKILTDRFGMSQTLSGVIMAADNVFALVLLPLFGIISDKCRSRLGRRTPFILVGTLLAVTAFISLSAVDAAQLSKLGEVSDINSAEEYHQHDNRNNRNLENAFKTGIFHQFRLEAIINCSFKIFVLGHICLLFWIQICLDTPKNAFHDVKRNFANFNTFYLEQTSNCHFFSNLCMQKA